MWHADKTPVQQELAENLANLIHNFGSSGGPNTGCFLYCDVFFETLSREWGGLDRYRLDKYLSLIRKTVEHMFAYAGRQGFDSA